MQTGTIQDPACDMSGLRFQDFASSSSAWKEDRNVCDEDDFRGRRSGSTRRRDDSGDRGINPSYEADGNRDQEHERKYAPSRTSGMMWSRGLKQEELVESPYVRGIDREDVDWKEEDQKTFKRDVETDFGKKTYMETAKKGEKETFYCEICMIELNSRETRNSHVAGTKHRQKEAMEPRGSTKDVRKIPNPLTLRKKIPQRLDAKIKNSKEPFIGLKSVQEYIPVSNDEMEPRYKCLLCANEGEANSMFNHILGKNHRQKFFMKHYPGKYENMRTIDLMRLAGNFAENDHTGEYITTFLSDEKYPWPAGKAPWSIEQGGMGLVPSEVAGRQLVKLVRPEDVEVNEASLERVLDYCSQVARMVDRYLRTEGRGKSLGSHVTKMRRHFEAMLDVEVKTEVKTEVKDESREVKNEAGGIKAEEAKLE